MAETQRNIVIAVENSEVRSLSFSAEVYRAVRMSTYAFGRRATIEQKLFWLQAAAAAARIEDERLYMSASQPPQALDIVHILQASERACQWAVDNLLRAGASSRHAWLGHGCCILV